MAYKVNYASNNLHDYVTILNVKRTVLPPRDNFSKNIPSINGEYYTGYKYTPRKIVLECVIFAESREEFMENVTQLAYLLDTKSPSKLIIEDTMDRHMYAVVDGEIDIQKIKHNGKFNIEFICYDPYAYSNNVELFSANTSGTITMNNNGTADALPMISVTFSKPSFFASFSMGNKVILVGQPNGVDDKVVPPNPVVLNDVCETLEGWSPIGNIVDNAEVNGSLSINSGGYAIYCNNYGSYNTNGQTKWHGGGARKNLSRTLTDFEVKVRFEHNSMGDLKGVGSGSTAPVTSGSYKVTAEPSLRIREGRGTNTKKLGSIPKGEIVEVSSIDKGWGYVNYNGIKGYISMSYVTKYTQPSTENQNGTYKVTAEPSLRLRSGRGTNYKQLATIKKGTQISISNVANGWGETTYNSKKGYVNMQYLSKVSKSRATNEDNTPSAENKIGQLQVLGYDANGNRLFCFKMIDSQKWYEYSEPEVYIGSKLVLDDGSKCPVPQTITNKDDDGKVTSVENTNSGAFGDWNCTDGLFKITRKTVDGKQQWQCEVQKLRDGQTVARRLLSNILVNSSYPNTPLSNIVIFFGQYETEPVVDTMLVSNITITDLSNPPKPVERQPIFEKGKELLIDVASQKVYYDSELFMTELDIGSEFFTVPTGVSLMKVQTDDNQADIEVGIQKRWI